jgi:hypothetical protein
MADFSTRLVLVERDVKQVLETLPTISTELRGIRSDMSEPQASPLGRALLDRATRNATRLDEHERQIDLLADWKAEMIGAYKFSRLVQTVLAIALGLLTIVQVGLATGRVP